MSLLRPLAERLAQAEKHVAQGERHITAQRATIERLIELCYDTTVAEELLTQFERSQELHIDGRDRLLREAAEQEITPQVKEQRP